jgi:hypothetical protein
MRFVPSKTPEQQSCLTDPLVSHEAQPQNPARALAHVGARQIRPHSPDFIGGLYPLALGRLGRLAHAFDQIAIEVATAARPTDHSAQIFKYPVGPNPGAAVLHSLTKRLEDHADGIENVAARPMADDMRFAAQMINRLVEEVGKAAATVNEAIAWLLEQATG